MRRVHFVGIIILVVILWAMIIYCKRADAQECGMGYTYIRTEVMPLQQFLAEGPRDVVDRILDDEVRMEVVFVPHDNSFLVGSQVVVYNVHCDGSVHDVRMYVSY